MNRIQRAVLISIASFGLLALPAFAGNGYGGGGGGGSQHHVSPDLTGVWQGHLSGDFHGPVTITIAQTAGAGTYTGQFSTTTDGVIDVSGAYTQTGRKLNGDATMGTPLDATVSWDGKSNWKGSRLKWTIVLDDGRKAIVHASPTY